MKFYRPLHTSKFLVGIPARHLATRFLRFMTLAYFLPSQISSCFRFITWIIRHRLYSLILTRLRLELKHTIFEKFSKSYDPCLHSFVCNTFSLPSRKIIFGLWLKILETPLIFKVLYWLVARHSASRNHVMLSLTELMCTLEKFCAGKLGIDKVTFWQGYTCGEKCNLRGRGEWVVGMWYSESPAF